MSRMRIYDRACHVLVPESVAAGHGLWTAARCKRGVTMIAVALVSYGCAVNSYQSARTLDPGQAAFYVAPSAMRLSVGGEATTLPFAQVGTRYGLTKGVDIGAHVGAGPGLDVKVQLARTATPTGGRDVAIAPGIGYLGGFSGTPTGSDGDDLHFFGATLPLLVTQYLGEHVAITVAPRLMYLLQSVETAGGELTHIASVGASLNIAVKVSENLRIVPGAGFSMPFYRSISTFGTDVGVGGQRLFQLGVGFRFGRE